PFFKYILTGLPLVVCKMAMTLDGKIATRAGQSQWISGPAARERVQEWRATYGCVMVGAGTVLADDPSLTCRVTGARQPWRVVVDPAAGTPATARWIGDDGLALLAIGEDVPDHCLEDFRARQVEILRCPLARPASFGLATSEGKTERLDLRFVVAELARRQIPSVLLEGGGGLNAAALDQGIVDRLRFFVSPLLVGGKAALTPLEGAGVADLAEAIRAEFVHIEPVGHDLLIEAAIRPTSI
ncbi:MAG: dihydrofolate reductase family protein, partial [Cyanobacteria bacterium REEB65]|nr:dihydrofolate reductase family protein [Cyanobacteria bacterium REEB65]